MYSRAWVVFTEFYQYYQSVHVKLPVLTKCVALFVSFLCAKRLASATISYLSATAYVHEIQGYYNPTKSFLIEKLLVAVGRCSQADISLPISRPLLYELIQALTHTCTSAYQCYLYRSMFMIAFYGFFRLGELASKGRTQLNVVDQFDQVTFLKQTYRVTAVQIVITRFKHNTCNRPFTILIESKPSEPYSPMQILIYYIKQRGYNQSPLFLFTSGHAVFINQFNTELRRALKFCGLDCSCNKSHSFHIGTACYAAEKGFSDAQIHALGRWSSNAFKIYICPPSVKAN